MPPWRCGFFATWRVDDGGPGQPRDRPARDGEDSCRTGVFASVWEAVAFVGSAILQLGRVVAVTDAQLTTQSELDSVYSPSVA